MKSRATRDGDFYMLNGRKSWVTSGPVADYFVVFMMTDQAKKQKGVSAFLVEGNTPGLTRGKKEPKLGIRASATSELIFENCRIPAGNLLGKEGEGFKRWTMSCSRGRRLMGVLTLTFAFLMGCLGSAYSQTANEYFEQGKADLANNSLSPAHTKFQLALALDPNHEGANLFCALTSLLMISNSSEFNSLLDRAGVSATGNVFAWEADFARDAYGNILLPANTPTGQELQTFAQNSLLPVIVDAIARLSKVGSGFQTNFDWAYASGQGYPSGLHTFATNTDYWYPNEWVGYKLLVAGTKYDIVSNTGSVLTVNGSLSMPAGTYEYKIVAP